MDGNRGAKGSIKDRLISMLYRLRYAKKQKESEYEIKKKEEQVAYLRRLMRLRETENINILDSQDKNALDKVEFNVNIKLANPIFTQSNSRTSYRVAKKGIENVDHNLSSIEQKTSELDEKVDLKKEINKTENEVVILKEINTFIEKSKETLNEIKDEVQSLKEVSKNKNQDTKELEERYKKLREKVDKLKKQYEAVKDKYDFSDFAILESIKLIDNIKDYQNRASLNEMDMMIKVCNKEIDKIDGVTVEYKKTKKVGSNIENIKKEQNEIKIKFHKSKEDINKIKYVEEDINYELKKQEEVIEEMYKEASYFEKIARTEFEYSGYGKMVSSLFKIAGGILTLPFTGSQLFGIALGNTMINKGLKTLNEGLDVKEKIVYDYKYKDISQKISDVQDKVEYTNLIISDNLNEISKLKDNFRKYNEFNKVLPEYDSMLEKIDNLESNLKKQQQKISKMDQKLEKEKDMNNQKLRKVLEKN